MEKKKTTPKTPAKPKSPATKKPAETSKEKMTQLANSVDALSSELETLKSTIQEKNSENTTLADSVAELSSELESFKSTTQKEKSKNTTLKNSVEAVSAELDILKLNVQKRKSENTTLKILFYTGLIVLLLGFVYTNSTLQRAQIDSMESSIDNLRTLMNQELLSVEKTVYQKFNLLEKNAGDQSMTNLMKSLENMTQSISQLDTGDEKTAELIDRVQKHSRELSEAYSEQRTSLPAGQNNEEEKSLEIFKEKTFGRDLRN